ncbi:diphosphomevalonate decarboxylase, partial [Lactobacillus delbrueckii]
RRELSRMARMGSGSASRSIFGGFSVWQKGDSDQTSYAYPLDEEPDMDLRLLAVEINDQEKKISSTKGMEMSKSSPFYQVWLDRNDSEIKEMEEAIKQADFSKLGSLAELNASEMHALTFTAVPGFTYFEPNTIKAIKLVQDLRQQGLECYYTIDAGPNVKVLCQGRNSKDIINCFESSFYRVKIIEAGFGPAVTLLD